jgi:hypothetical protein
VLIERRRTRMQDLPGVPAHGLFEVDVEAVSTDAVRMEPDVVGAPPELLHAHGAHRAPLEVPPEQTDLPPREHPLGALDILGRGFDREHRRHVKVGEEPQERLGALHLVDPLHAEVLERGERVDDEPTVVVARPLHLQRLLERGERDLDARQLRSFTDEVRNLGEGDRVADLGDVLEGGALVPHHIGDGVEHVDPVEVGLQVAVVEPHLVRGLLQGDNETLLPVPRPLAQELERQRRLACTGRPDHEVRTVGHQAPVQHAVQLRGPGGDSAVGHRRVSGSIRHARTTRIWARSSRL